MYFPPRKPETPTLAVLDLSGYQFISSASSAFSPLISSSVLISTLFQLIGGIGILLLCVLRFVLNGIPFVLQCCSYHLRTMEAVTNPFSNFATFFGSSPFSNRSPAVRRRILLRFVLAVVGILTVGFLPWYNSWCPHHTGLCPNG